MKRECHFVCFVQYGRSNTVEGASDSLPTKLQNENENKLGFFDFIESVLDVRIHFVAMTCENLFSMGVPESR